MELLPPLRNTKIVITRDAKIAEPLTERLLSHGATLIPFPPLTFHPLPMLEFDQFDFNRFDWIFFTSSNSVNFFFDKIANNRWQLLEEGWQMFKVAAFGKVTAAILEGYGVKPDLVLPRFWQKEVTLAQLGPLEGTHGLYLRARSANRTPISALARAGMELFDLPLYDVTSKDPADRTWHTFQQGFDVVLFTDPGTVTHFMSLIAKSAYNTTIFNDVIFGSMGEITSEAMRQAGLPVTFEADPPTLSGLVSGLVAQLKK